MSAGAAIVLVGGFSAWGRDEVFGLKYWGGPGRDVEAELRALGHQVCTAAPGPSIKTAPSFFPRNCTPAPPRFTFAVLSPAN